MRTFTTITGLAIAITALAACSTTGGGANNAEGGTGGELTGNVWVLETYEQDGTRKEVPGDVTVDAKFDGASTTVAGTAGCNQYSGPYTLSGADLTFGAIAATQMMCVGAGGDVEAAYLTNLGLVKSYTATEDTLTLHDANHTAILSYSAAAAGTLEGVTWHATGINNGKEAVVSVEAGTDPTLVYEKAGTITGNATCNSFNGPAVVDGSNVKVGPLNSTRMACADEAKNAQEAAYLAALENATTFEVRAGHLELRDAQGALQVSFETR